MVNQRVAKPAVGTTSAGIRKGVAAIVPILVLLTAAPFLARMEAHALEDSEQDTPKKESTELHDSTPKGKRVDPAGALPDEPARGLARAAMLDLEDALARAELVIVVRLVDMSETMIVRGGKQEQVTQQFKFEPVRTLKGIYARDALLLTGEDLGIYRFAEGTSRIEPGQMLLLLLGRSGPGYFNCNEAGSLDQSIPRLRDQDDPLLSAVETLTAVTQQRDRLKKVSLLLDGLRAAKGRDTVPLLISLRRRALLAAQTPGALEVMARPLTDRSPVVREAAAKTLAALLDADYLNLREGAAEALVGSLDRAGPDLEARVAALEALGAVGAAAQHKPAALAWLRLDRESTTFAERTAQLHAIGRIGVTDQRDAITDFLTKLPLDAPPDVQAAAGRALGRLDPGRALGRIVARLASKHEAGLGIATELALIGDLPPGIAAPALLDAARRPLDLQERLTLAAACEKVADPRLVPALVALLDPRQPNIRWQAMEALRTIDTDEAAKALWPHLGEEADLARKLRLAEFLGRHGYRGGYPFAIEHMSEPTLRDLAVEALAAIREPKAVPELRKIWETSHDLGWNAAAIRALGRLGQAELAPRMLALARDLKGPLAPSALIALGDLGAADALPIVREGLSSRSDEVVIASARASAKLLVLPGVEAGDVRDRLASLLADPDATPAVRVDALGVLVALDDPRLGEALAAAARDGRLEGSDLLRRIEDRLAARKARVVPL